MNKHYINRCLRWLTNEITPFYIGDVLPEELHDKISTFYNCIRNSIDWFNLTKADVKNLGFLNWEEDEDSMAAGVWFIPTWLFPAIPEGFRVTDKDGKSFAFHALSASQESMYGYLTYGIPDVCLEEEIINE